MNPGDGLHAMVAFCVFLYQPAITVLVSMQAVCIRAWGTLLERLHQQSSHSASYPSSPHSTHLRLVRHVPVFMPHVSFSAIDGAIFGVRFQRTFRSLQPVMAFCSALSSEALHEIHPLVAVSPKNFHQDPLVEVMRRVNAISFVTETGDYKCNGQRI